MNERNQVEEQYDIARDGMDSTEAEEFFAFNVEGAGIGVNGPIYVDLYSPEDSNRVE